MSISKASRVTEAKRHFVIAIDGFKEGKINGLVYHMNHSAPKHFASLMDLVWIIEAISDDLCWPVSLMKQRNFKKVLPVARKSIVEENNSKVRRGKLATLKLKLVYRNYASWQGVVAWVDKGETKGFNSFLELTRYIGKIMEPEEEQGMQDDDSLICNICVDDYESSCLEGRITPLSKSEPSSFRSVFELAKNLDAMMAKSNKEKLASSLLEKRLVGEYYLKGKRANFVVRIRFCEHATWQGTIFWKEMKQTVNFRSFLELVKLMDLAVLNAGHWTDGEKAKAASE